MRAPVDDSRHRDGGGVSGWMDGWMDEGGLVGTDTHTTFLSLLNVCHSPSSLPEYAAHTIVSRVDTMYVRVD